MLKMKRAIWIKWRNALLSGAYKQGRGALHQRGYQSGGVDKPDLYCCLGVLCALAEEAGAVEIDAEVAGSEISYGGSKVYMPPEVIAWAGLEWEGVRAREDAEVEEARGILDGNTGLAVMNDSGYSFREIEKTIADKIVPV
jgi:hypothetical protein